MQTIITIISDVWLKTEACGRPFLLIWTSETIKQLQKCMRTYFQIVAVNNFGSLF